MKITVAGEKKEVADGLTVAALIEAENVETVLLVPLPGDHDVLQRGPDPVVHEHADAGPDGQLPGLHHPGPGGALQHHPGEDLH